MQALPLNCQGWQCQTNKCMSNVCLSVYLQMLIIRTQIGTHLVNCVQISCHIRSAYNTSSASSPLEHIPWGKHRLSTQGTASSCQCWWRCVDSQHVHNFTFVPCAPSWAVYRAQVYGEGSQSSRSQQPLPSYPMVSSPYKDSTVHHPIIEEWELHVVCKVVLKVS